MTPRTLVLCTVALACKARTDLHYSLPLTVADVGVAGCTTTWSFADRHSRPGPVLESRYFRAPLHRYLRPKPKNLRPNLPGLTEAFTPAKRHGRVPFPPLPTVSSARPLDRVSAEADNPEYGGGSRNRTAYRRLAKAVFYQ